MSSHEDRERARKERLAAAQEVARALLFDGYNEPVIMLNNWRSIGKFRHCPEAQQEYFKKLEKQLRVADDLNKAMASSCVLSIGGCTEALFAFTKMCENMATLNAAAPFHAKKYYLSYEVRT